MCKENSIRNIIEFYSFKNIKNVKYINPIFETYKIKFKIDANKMKWPVQTSQIEISVIFRRNSYEIIR